MIDLRSDTVTRPTEAMRTAMARAEVGDDVYGEDPTVRALEERVAALFGHEDALFTPTGSLANVLAVGLSVAPGQEVLCEASAHDRTGLSLKNSVIIEPTRCTRAGTPAFAAASWRPASSAAPSLSSFSYTSGVSRSSVASPAATATGFPLNVPAW